MKKFIALFLVLSILLFSGHLFAKERKGAELSIQKKDGFYERGELIAVKQDSILLLDIYSGTDVSVEVKNIGLIKIVKESKFWQGAGIGFLIGGTGGGIIAGVTAKDDPPDTFFWQMSATEKIIAAVFSIGIIGGLLGGAVGATVGKDKTFHFEGKSDSEIQEILEKLRKKARVRNYQ
ncbi:MAG: hypothetical protein ACFFDT_35635 [Candidatus Hodarchaeota archaeon]